MSGSFFIDAKVVGIPEIKGFFEDLARTDLRDRLREASRLVTDTAKGLTKSKRVKAALTYDVSVKSPTEFRAVVGPLRKRAFFGAFLEFGTKAHAIQDPFGWKGVTIFHPGARAQPFLMPAEDQTEEQVIDIVGRPFLLEGGAPA